jgi:hypothetical protein
MWPAGISARRPRRAEVRLSVCRGRWFNTPQGEHLARLRTPGIQPPNYRRGQSSASLPNIAPVSIVVMRCGCW